MTGLQGQVGLLSTYDRWWGRRGALGVIVAAGLIAFYVALYQTEAFTPLSTSLGLPNKWYFYGLLYSVVMAVGAARHLWLHGSSRYLVLRTTVNLLFQVVFAFTLPLIMQTHLGYDYYFSYFWPLKIEYLYPHSWQTLPAYIVGYSVVASFVVVPVLTIRVGKRWYCSWVCGCGALANTFGDPWRHLSNKSPTAWRIERLTVHTSLVVAVVVTAVVAAAWMWGNDAPWLFRAGNSAQSAYRFYVGFCLAAALGVGAYPLFGTRVWCRFFCPMAALLGLIQKLGRFRIRVKEDMCIACGNCSTYCEMGIDVRAYAMRNESFTRASCVGCGMCAHVCPRGVLRLENAPRRRLPTV